MTTAGEAQTDEDTEPRWSTFIRQSNPLTPMSYLKDFGDKLALKLSALPETERTEIVTFVKTEVLTSYRNGQRDGEKNRTPVKTDARPSQPDPTGRTTPTKRRNYQHR